MKNLVIIILFSFFIFIGCDESNKETSSNLESNVNEIENKNFELEEEINNMKSKIDKYENQILYYKNEIDELQEEISKLESNIDETNNRINHVNPFDEKEINVLDTVCDLTLIDKRTIKKGDIEEVTLLNFKGAIKVSGTFKNIGKGETDFMSYKILFYPDEKSSKDFPKVNKDNRILWFILNDYDEVKKYFGDEGDSGKATIIIDNYTIDLRHMETANSADLIYVINTELIKE